MSQLHLDYYSDNVRNFTIYSTLVMLLLVFNYDTEASVFETIFRQKLNTPETHGQMALSYAYEFSLITNSNIFICNFLTFMIYFQFCLVGLSLGITFEFPLFCQFLILFFYCNKHFTLHLRILAMDKYENKQIQKSWMTCQQIQVYALTFAGVLFIRDIVFTDVFIFLIFGNIWIPQIFRNSVYGYKDCPKLVFMVVQTIHLLYFPLYFKLINNNFLFTKPDYNFIYLMSSWLLLQIIVLKVQQKNPRFLMPQCIRRLVFSGYYNYEKTFSEDASI